MKAAVRGARRPLALAPAAALLALAATALAHAHPPRPHHFAGPFAAPATAAFLRTRSGEISAAAYNLRTGRLFL